MYRTLMLVLLVAACATTETAGQDFIVAQSQTQERIVGLLHLPELYGEYPCQAFKAKKINLYATASDERPPIGTIERTNAHKPPEHPDCDEPIVVVRGLNGNISALPYDESGDEFRTAVAYERSGRWFRIALSRGSGWIQADPDNFLAYPDILMSESFATYLRPGWDGNVWTEPGSGSAEAAPSGWRVYREKEIPIRILATRIVAGVVWIQIRFESEFCGQTLGKLPPLQGWLPAYKGSVDTSVWFYSRGC